MNSIRAKVLFLLAAIAGILFAMVIMVLVISDDKSCDSVYLQPQGNGQFVPVPSGCR